MRSTAYHPQSNGMVERFHWQLKAALRARCSGADWLEHLPWVMLGLRAAPKEEAGCRQQRPHMAIHWCCPVSCSCLHMFHKPPAKMEIPSTIKPAKPTIKEEERCGSPGGHPRVRARGSGHRAAGHHVPRSILREGNVTARYRLSFFVYRLESM